MKIGVSENMNSDDQYANKYSSEDESRNSTLASTKETALFGNHIADNTAASVSDKLIQDNERIDQDQRLSNVFRITDQDSYQPHSYEKGVDMDIDAQLKEDFKTQSLINHTPTQTIGTTVGESIKQVLDINYLPSLSPKLSSPMIEFPYLDLMNK